MRRALAPPRLDRLEAHAVSRLHERQRRRRRRGEAVGQEVQELEQALAPRGAESGRQVGNRLLGQVAGDPVQRRVADPPRRARLRVRRPRANDEVVRVEMRDQPDRVVRLMLAVGVDDQDECARRLTNAGLDRRAVAFVVRMTDDARAGGRRPRAGVVRRAVVDDEDLVPGRGGAQVRDQRPNRSASLNAGMTIDVAAVLETVAIVLGAADEPLNNPVPRDRVRPVVSRVAEGLPPAGGPRPAARSPRRSLPDPDRSRGP